MAASRRSLAVVSALVLMLASLMAAPGVAAQDGVHTRVYRYLMGTSVQVEANGGDPTTRQRAIEEAFGAMGEVDRLMSNYRPDSELARINERAAREAVAVSAPMLSVLAAAQRVSAASHGAFDISVGPIVRLWGFHDKKPHLPSEAEFASVRPLVDYRQVVVDAARRTVRFDRSGVELDLGGIAKGFAVEVAANVLRRYGLSGFIDAGGNQYLLGAPPGKQRWTVGIRDPDRPGHVLGAVDTGETAVSTSADTSTFVEIAGQRYGHVLDPHTLRPSASALSVTILGSDSTLADALSKAVFVLGPTGGLHLLESFPGMSAVVAYRRPDGSVGVAVSPRVAASFRRVRA